MNTERQITKRFSKKLKLCLAVILFATFTTIILHTRPVLADDGGYPWIGATAVNPPAPDYTSSYGYSTCPSNDTGCLSGGSALVGSLAGVTYGEADPWNMALRNCTSYVAWKENQVFGINLSGSWGNASNWDTYATGHGYSNDTSPHVGDIAQWNATTSDSFGHVSYVWKVSGGTAYFYDYNVGWDGLFYSTYTSSTEPGGTPNNYISMGTVPTAVSKPAAITRASTNMDIFYRDTNNNLLNVGWDYFAGGWASPAGRGLTCGPGVTCVASDPSAVARSTSAMDVFYRDSSNYLENTGWNGSTWSSTNSRAINVAGDPFVISRNSTTMDVFFRDTGNNLEYVEWTSGGGWTSQQGIGLTCSGSNPCVAGDPIAVSRGTSTMDVFYRDSNGNLENTGYSSGTWSSTNSRASSVSGNPAVISRYSTSMDLFYRDTNNNLLNVDWDANNGGWGSPVGRGLTCGVGVNCVAGYPTALTRAWNGMDVFYPDSAGNLENTGMNGSTWSGTYSRGSGALDNPTAITRDANDMDVFYLGSGGLQDSGWNSGVGWGQSTISGTSNMY